MKFKAFTLVELLVVMAIISFLSVGAFAGLSFGLRQARDTQRKKAAELVQIALQAYYSDYASYPKCADNNGNGTAIGGTEWSFCSGAFPKLSSTGTSTPGFLIDEAGRAGVKDYLEGEWPRGNGNIDPGDSDEFLRYYVNSTGTKLKFAVCTTLENTTAAGNLTRRATEERDCYCVGTSYEEVSCAGMTGRRRNN